MRNDIILKLQRIIEGNDRITWDLFPAIYDGFLEADELSLAEDRMLRFVASTVQRCSDDKIISTASEERIAEYESEFGLSSDGLNIEQRRQQVIGYIHRSRVFNETTLHELCQSLAEEYSVYERLDVYNLSLGVFTRGNQDELPAVEIIEQIKPIVPQNLALYAGVETSFERNMVINHAHFSALHSGLGIVEWHEPPEEPAYFGGDFSGNNIRMESVDGGGGLIDKYASYKTLFELRGWEPGGLFIDKPKMMGICGVLTETSDSVVLVDVLKQLSVGRIEFTGDLTEGGIPESGVVEEYVPAPVLPTVERGLSAYGTYQSGTKSLAPNDIGVLYLRNESTTAVIYDDNYLYSVYRYYYDVLGASEWRIGAFFEAVKDGTAVAAKNITNSTISYIGLYTYATCSDTQAEVVTVFNASDEAFNAFKYTVDNTDYYYVLDDTQTDWADDLSSIGYHLPPVVKKAYLTTTPHSDKYLNPYREYFIVDENDNYIPYDSSKSYTLIGKYKVSGSVVTGNMGLIDGDDGFGTSILKLYNGSSGVEVGYIEYTATAAQ